MTDANDDDELDVLLVEDNPGDARLIEEMLSDVRELPRRIDPERSTAGRPRIHRENRLADGLEYLEEHDPDVVLLDLNLPDSDGLETLEAVESADEEAPIVVLTGLRDQRTGIEAIGRGAEDYLVKDEVTSALLVRSIQHAIERKQQELERARRRRQLEALNRLNRIGQDVTHAVIRMSTREELEQVVCDRLAESDAYRFAWIGEVAPGRQQVTPTVSAGVEEGYLDEITVTVDNSPTARGPAGEAVRTKELQVVRDIETDPSFEPWREDARERGYRSSAAIPIVYGELLHGVLNVYAGTPDAFSETEVEVLARLGEIVGHAITALERKDALLTDAALELEFRVGGVAEPLVDLSAAEEGCLRFERLIRSGEDTLIYGSATDVPREPFAEAVERTDFLEEMRALTQGRTDYEFELIASREVPLFETVATHGGRVQSATVDDGEFRVVVELPQRSDTGQFIETVESAFAGVEYVAQRTIQRDENRLPEYATLERKLTEKQHAALETAVAAGYFEWPRTTSGKEVAERLDISPATFTQHLRAAERKFFEEVFGEAEESERSE
ncbi:bacterio-opsin activator domain-containing protein [Salinilacihabitans rarus]|uniref:bacterio-opsin activator domain-containing protein n=1 Tax=Salinilacihabitans rarus TaxID=2961596 RepID=UPI0020C85201|nr:bacterio-opsin activator domain-containing protein [Salinilacihabitans rarus]